ncbi:MAG TPA: HAMP domain-containing sensor histidine kinase, partial [Flavobacteriales bacterium]|nr:HAMP domain-containing sensor histidine kinase [Flavobacteriales bacterium]
TPLSTIMSSTDLIARYVDGNERVDKHVTRIRGKVREMTSMLNEFLSLERIEQGLVNCQPTHFDIVHLGIELIEELRTLTGDGQTITYDHEGSDRNVTLDRQMLGNVIVNLMTNAVKYSPQGKPITMRTVIKDGRLRVTVHDQGIGVPEDDHQHLFERFFRGSNVTTIQGTGLGLNLVKRYLDIMQGGIGFSSVPGNTVFTVDLPQHLPVVEGPGHVPAQTTI